MAVAAPTTPFVWGAGGAMKTPEQIAREREIAQALMQGGADYSPVDSWLQGAARVAQAGAGALKGQWADEAEATGREGFQTRFDSVFGGGQAAPVQTASIDPVAAALVGAPATATDATASIGQAAPTVSNVGGDKQAFIDMLMPGAMEASQRTGIDPRIIIAQAAQETGWGKSAPGNNYFGIKSHGQGGGQTLNTHEYVNGKRVNVADSFRAFGSPGESVAGYADFIQQNPRYKPLMQAQGLDAQLEALQASGYATDPNYSASVGSIARGISLPGGAGAPIAQASSAIGPIQTGQAGPQPSIEELIGLSSDPWANDSQKAIIQSLLGQQIEQQDPMYQMQMQAAQQGLTKGDLEIAQLLNPQVEAPKPIEVGGVLLDPTTYQPIFDSREPAAAPKPIEVGGVLLDPVTFQPIYDSRPPEDGQTDTQRNLSWRAEQAGLKEGTPEYAEFMRSGGQSSGMALSVGADGTVQFAQGGAGMKALTETQSKDTVFATRAAGALPTIDALGSNLTDLRTSVTGQTPVVGNFTKSPEYQQAEQAGTEFLQAILRKDTGAAITPQETEEYGKVYLPRPGDSPQLLEQKRVARQRALEAIKAGMPPQAILQSEQALVNSGGEGMTAPQQSQARQVNTEAEYNALPSGSVYMDPTGQIRTKR